MTSPSSAIVNFRSWDEVNFNPVFMFSGIFIRFDVVMLNMNAHMSALMGLYWLQDRYPMMAMAIDKMSPGIISLSSLN